jgi:hypothetical protein
MAAFQQHTHVNLKRLDIIIGTVMVFLIKMLEQAKATSSYYRPYNLVADEASSEV